MPTNVKILGEALRPSYDIVVATNGRKALEIAQTQRPDLILLDIMMPELDGYAVCRLLKEDDRTKNIPVIFITAKDQTDDELRGLEMGAVDYITKPFQVTIVKARVRTQLDLKRKYDLLESMVSLDGLTEIPNRRRFDEVLEQEWRRMQRAGQSLAALMIDIDYFKNYNDAYGHAAGDACLKAVARALSQSLHRPADLMARYGGEEFAAILPETNAAGALALGEKLRLNVENLRIPHEHSSAAAYVTISVGSASALPAGGGPASALVEAADAMLYKAKQAGRNQVAGEGAEGKGSA
jgi:diguanylate cyclase (GGDEF)-like protein